MGITHAAVIVALSGSLVAQPSQAMFASDVKQHVQHGNDTKAVKVVVFIGTDDVTVRRNQKDETIIPYTSIVSMTYDRRRKSRGLTMQGMAPRQQHMLTIQFKTGDTGDFVELEMAKDVAPRLVATLEAKSGKPIEKIVG